MSPNPGESEATEGRRPGPLAGGSIMSDSRLALVTGATGQQGGGRSHVDFSRAASACAEWRATPNPNPRSTLG